MHPGSVVSWFRADVVAGPGWRHERAGAGRVRLHRRADDQFHFSPDHQRRHAAAVTRQLTLLRLHAIIVRVPHTHRYHLSAYGRRLVTAIVAAHAADVNQLTGAA